MIQKTQRKSSAFQKLGDVINKYKLEDKDKYISREFQKYAYELAEELNDMAHKSLYMRLAKSTPRVLLENARSFVKDAANAKSKGRLFMWKLSQLKAEKGKTQVERNSK